MSTEGGTRAIVAAFFSNLGIAIAKLIGFVFTGSTSMLAESIHSLADTGNQGLLMLGGRMSRRPADDEHAFGYGRERYFWAFVVSLVLFTLGSVFAIYKGVTKISNPHEIESEAWAIGILLVAIVLEGYSFRTAIVESNRIRAGRSWPTFIRRSKKPELPVVLLEDAGALFGLVIALSAIGMSVATGDAIWDGIGTLTIGLLLGAIAAVLAVEMRSLLIGESGSARDVAAIEEAIRTSPRVRRLIHLRTQHMGPEELLVGAKVAFDPDLALAELASAIDELERRVREQVPYAQPMYVEPDLDRGDAGAGVSSGDA